WPRDWSSDVCSSDLVCEVQLHFMFMCYNRPDEHERQMMNKRRARTASPAAPAEPKREPETAPENRGGSYFAMASDLEAAIGRLQIGRASCRERVSSV